MRGNLTSQAPIGSIRAVGTPQLWHAVCLCLVWVFVAALVSFQLGCASAHNAQSDRFAEGATLFSAKSASSSSALGAQSDWAIALYFVSGEPSAAAATAANEADRIGQVLGRTDLWVRAIDGGAAVMLGRYENPSLPQAQADLAYVKGFTVDDTSPFGRAYFQPPRRQASGGDPALNLVGAAQRAGVPNAVYTLQVAAYRSPNRRESRSAAERGARMLRDQGEEAFYYHGPNVSMVTVGLFSKRELGERFQSPKLDELRARHPHNLVNGAQFLVRSGSGEAEPQSSLLIVIPES